MDARPGFALLPSEVEGDPARAPRTAANGYLLKSMEPNEVVDAIQHGTTVATPNSFATPEDVPMSASRSGKQGRSIPTLVLLPYS